MTNEELQTLLPLAAKACGFGVRGFIGDHFIVDFPGNYRGKWNPLSSAEDCAEMNAALNHNTYWWPDRVYIGNDTTGTAEAQHDGTTQDKLRAWMEASVRAAVIVGEKK